MTELSKWTRYTQIIIRAYGEGIQTVAGRPVRKLPHAGQARHGGPLRYE